MEYAETRSRADLVRRGKQLAFATIGWNTLEGLTAIASGVAAGSIALVGFGVDSYVEVFAGAVVLWRLRAERNGKELSARAERRAVKLIAATFLLLAAGILVESVRKFISGEHPHSSVVGIVVTVVSLIVMPILARAKRRVGVELDSRAVTADATETTLCVWLSAIVLVGLILNASFGWWWADPLAALGIVYIAAKEGVEHWRANALDDCCC